MSWLINMLSEVSDIFSDDAGLGDRRDRNGRTVPARQALAPSRASDLDRRPVPRREQNCEDRFDHFW